MCIRKNDVNRISFSLWHKWEYNTTEGAVTSITPSTVAYDIYYHVQRAMAGASQESKLRENMGGFVHDYEDC